MQFFRHSLAVSTGRLSYIQNVTYFSAARKRLRYDYCLVSSEWDFTFFKNVRQMPSNNQGRFWTMTKLIKESRTLD